MIFYLGSLIARSLTAHFCRIIWHHHFFLNGHFFQARLGLDIFPDMRWGLFTYPWTLSIQGASQALTFVSSFTHSLSSWPFSSSHHLHISTGRHPIISTVVPHMPKPPQSTMPHRLGHALNTQKTVHDLTSLPIFQRRTTHPSHHHTLCSLQAMAKCRFLTLIAHVWVGGSSLSLAQDTFFNSE